MKVEVTKPGLYGLKGELEVGSTHFVKSVPDNWKHHVKVLEDDEVTEEHVPVVNPASDEGGSDDEPQDDEDSEADEELEEESDGEANAEKKADTGRSRRNRRR